MPTLDIKDPEVYALAKELSAREAVSMTAVIKDALQERAAAARASKEGLVEWLLDFGARNAPLLAHLPADPVVALYDDQTGLPRWSSNPSTPSSWHWPALPTGSTVAARAAVPG